MKRMTPEQALKVLGIQSNGKLSPCPEGMHNCVCSDYKDKFSIESWEANKTNTLAKIKELLIEQEGYEFESEAENYMHFTFTSKVLKFVDDIEFRYDGKKLIHIRSASRLGNWDLGANKKRIKWIRSLIAAQ